MPSSLRLALLFHWIGVKLATLSTSVMIWLPINGICEAVRTCSGGRKRLNGKILQPRRVGFGLGFGLGFMAVLVPALTTDMVAGEYWGLGSNL